MAGRARSRRTVGAAAAASSALCALLAGGALAGAAVPAVKGAVSGQRVPAGGLGYRLVASDGGVFTFGGLQFYGSMGGKPLNQPITGIASPDSTGYWLVAKDGGVFSFGDAPYLGSPGLINPALPPGPANSTVPSGSIVGLAPDYAAPGYWEASSDGGVYSFGGASFFGSMAGRALSAPIAGIAPTGDGGGYWLVGVDGAVYAFGDAVFPPNFAGPVSSGTSGTLHAAGIAAYGSDNASFAVVTDANQVYPYGAVTTSSGSPFVTISTGGPPIVGATTTAAGTATPGLWTVSPVGGVYSFGSAGFFGSMAGQPLNRPIVGIDGY